MSRNVLYPAKERGDSDSCQSMLKSELGDDFEIKDVDAPKGSFLDHKYGTHILRKTYFTYLSIEESPITESMVKDRSILYKWAKHPEFNVGDGSLRIDGSRLFPKKIVINYDRNSVEMDFEMYEIIENGEHRGFVTKPDNASMRFEHAYVQTGYDIKKIKY